ncbi:MAG: MFS transporter [Desulfobacteraceae bacterium]|nr:MFS transporter [Pseudomonadota bacterium]MCG2750306.1 MFS transporter [Desulfobacteraceae bacterium]
MQGKSGFYGWITLSAAALVYFLMCGVLLYSFGVFLPFICQEFDWGRGAVSGAYTAMMLSGGLVGPFAGIFITKYGPRSAIVLGNLLAASGLILLAFHTRMWQLYVSYGVLIGIGIGFGGFIATTTIANNWFNRNKSLALSIVITCGGLGGLFLIPGIMAIIQRVGWRGGYGVMFSVTLVFMVIIPGLVIRNKPEDLGQVRDGLMNPELENSSSAPSTSRLYSTPVDFSLRQAIRTPSLWLILIAVTIQLFAMSMLATHQVAFLVDMGISASVAATALGLLPGTSTIGRLAVGLLGLRYNMRFLAICAFVVMTTGMALALLTRSLPMAFLYVTVFGIGFGAFVVANTALFSIYFGATSYPKIIGFVSFFAVTGSIGAPLAGALYDYSGSYMVPFSIAFLALLVGLACMVFARPPQHPSLSGEKKGTGVC